MASEQEFVVRVPQRDETKKYHVMKFRSTLNQDFSKWSACKMVRENNQKIVQASIPQDDDPKFGAGSVFGKEMKEEARLKKLGIIRKKYNPDAQPWMMKVNGKGGKRYKGTREGGVSDNTSFYVFTHGADGAFEAFPISEWYNFIPLRTHKTLSAEEAEEKYAQRGKILNKWAVMVNNKLKTDEDGVLDGETEGDKNNKGKKKSAFKVSDMDDWEDGGDALDTSSDEEKTKKDDSDSDSGKKKRTKDTKKKKKKNKTDVDEALEDSDDGDDEGREVDYMSDESSDSEEELEKEHDIKGVDQDEGISKMLDSDSDSDEEKKKSGDDDEDDEDETGKKKKKKAGSDDEGEDKKSGKKKKSAPNSRSATPTKDQEKMDRDEKRKAMVANLLDPNASGESAAKKSRLEQFGSSSASSSSTAFGEITEEAVRRYLKRRPMTTTDLLKKFKAKKSGANANELVQHLANVLKKINPHKQKSQGTVYLSLKD